MLPYMYRSGEEIQTFDKETTILLFSKFLFWILANNCACKNRKSFVLLEILSRYEADVSG